MITNSETEKQPLQDEKILLFGNTGNTQKQDNEIMQVFKEAS